TQPGAVQTPARALWGQAVPPGGGRGGGGTGAARAHPPVLDLCHSRPHGRRAGGGGGGGGGGAGRDGRPRSCPVQPVQHPARRHRLAVHHARVWLPAALDRYRAAPVPEDLLSMSERFVIEKPEFDAATGVARSRYGIADRVFTE